MNEDIKHAAGSSGGNAGKNSLSQLMDEDLINRSSISDERNENGSTDSIVDNNGITGHSKSIHGRLQESKTIAETPVQTVQERMEVLSSIQRKELR